MPIDNIMLKVFRGSNFASFKEDFELDFTLDGNAPDHIFRVNGMSTVLGLKGANGSGKTNILKAFSILSWIATKSANLDNDQPLPIPTHFDNKDPAVFYCEFLSNGQDYIYELKANENEVIFEKLSKVDEKRKKILFIRNLSEFSKLDKDLKELENVKLKPNASVLCLVKKLKFKSNMVDLENALEFFQFVISNVTYSGLSNKENDYSEISKIYQKSKEAFNFVKTILKSVDPGISDIEIFETEGEDGEKRYFPIFYHGEKSKNIYTVFSEESSGVKKLFICLHIYWVVIETGGILIQDEFDIHLHSLLLPQIIDLFDSSKHNSRGAQFIFTAHNTEIVDTLGKYRTILINKEDNESYSYRLDEVPGSILRNDRKISPIYLSGKIGGVPSFE